MRFSSGVLNFVQIGPSAAKLWRHGNFQDGGRLPCWICFKVVIDHPWNVIDGLNLVLKFRLDLMYNCGDSVILYFAALAEKCLFTANFRGFWSVVHLNDVIYRPDPKKGHPCAKTRRLRHKAWKSVQRFDMGACPRKNTGQSKKSQSYEGFSPPEK